MPDYIQLLESKLSPNQKQALNAMTDVARARGITLFLTGGAVRDIISGASVRDLDITVQANPVKFKKELEKSGFSVTGEHEGSQTVYLRYGHQARVEISASRTENFPKPARPEYHSAAIIDDLHRRDFTANAMALSLNEGSWGLLLDPLNGMADIAARQLRLVSNYGFLEDPIRMVRATRLLARTGWEMDERTRARYDNAKTEGVISALTPAQRGYELEEIAYEEDPLQVMRALEAEGWMEHLTPDWNSHSVDTAGLDRLHERLVQLLMAGLHPDPSPAQFRLLTAKLSQNQLAALKKLFVRKDLIEEVESLDNDAKHLLQQISGKEAAKSSQLWKLMHGAKQEAVLWLFFTGKSTTVQNRFENFFAKWPEARQKIPNAILQDMRITPDVEGYAELLDKLTFAFMDGELPNEEAVRKFAEPYSPPAPPPPVIVRRSRAVKRIVDPKGGKGRGRKGKKAIAAEQDALTPTAEATEQLAGIAAEVEPSPVINIATKKGVTKHVSTRSSGTESSTGVAQLEKSAGSAGRKSSSAAHAIRPISSTPKSASRSKPDKSQPTKDVKTKAGLSGRTHGGSLKSPSASQKVLGHAAKGGLKAAGSKKSGSKKSAGHPATHKASSSAAHRQAPAKGNLKAGPKPAIASAAHKSKIAGSTAAKKVGTQQKSSSKQADKSGRKSPQKDGAKATKSLSKPADRSRPEAKIKKSSR
jgi:tRNA nucleotidyltransferase (CCA-adding enzyme)